MPTAIRLLALGALMLLATTHVGAQPAGFQPALQRAELLPTTVAPGGQVSLTLWFRNTGTGVAAGNYRVFVHFEDPLAGCEKIAWQADHDPFEPVGYWLPGDSAMDGPLLITVPDTAAAGRYRVHVGVFDPAGGPRLLDVAAGELLVDPKAAPSAAPPGPAPLTAAETARRQAARPALRQPLSLAGPAFDFALEPGVGRWTLRDRAANVTWTSNPLQARFGRIVLRRGDEVLPLVLNDLRSVASQAGQIVVEQALKARDGQPLGLTFRLHCESDTRPPTGLRLRYEVLGQSAWQVDRVWLLDGGLPVTEAGAGRTVLPIRLGKGLSAGEGLPTVESRLTYDDSSMQMMTLEQSGGALLVTWEGVDVRWQVRRAWLDDERLAGARVIQHTVELAGDARAVTLHPVGRGDYVTAARAYRDVAQRAGWRVTRPERARTHPEVNAMAGAADFKPFVFTRTVADSVWNKSGKEQIHVGFSFDETAQLAEHWKRDLQLDRAMVVLAGWIKRGYDNQHPDILPAAPECGGDARLAEASRRIKAQGYLFGLHDNYQDMYEDAPSFDHKYLRRDANGKSLMGGNWAGGQAWQVRPQSQLELAQRNLPEVRRLFEPTIYFIDTVFAWGLVDSRYAADRWDRTVDLDYKMRLCRYAREQMGLFGSEEGREWAVPVADYLEGQFGHKWDTAPGEVLPIFPIVYHDCVSLTTHQSTRLGPSADKHLLDHLVYGEMPVYEFGNHLYWKAADAEPLPVTVRAEVKGAGAGQLDVTYRWRPTATLPADFTAFVHFTQTGASHAEGIVFQDDHQLAAGGAPSSRWAAGVEAVEGPRRVTVPAGVSGDVDLWIGLLAADGARQQLAQGGGSGLRYRLGTVHLNADGVTFTPAPTGTAQPEPFCRKEGWTRDLGRTDRFIKNSYEVLSWVHRLSFGVPMEAHEVRAGLERTRFGADLHVVANYGDAPVTLDAGPVLGRVTLPRHGFAVWSPTFVAVHATAAGGQTYGTPALYTARSLDGKPLATGVRARVYHGCGGPELGLLGRVVEVDREAELVL